MGANHPTFAKVVCLSRLSTRDLTESGSQAEVNIGMSSSNFAYSVETFWPTQASDCGPTSTYHAGWGARTRSCSVSTNGGALNVSNLCTSMYDKEYVVGVRVREIDDGGSGDD